ncbi:4-hydroxy-3-methylbut-2-enyl diphosphate reductase [Pyruvatibacter mobilis]|uniref:4-hydroxy-3-methylbut-2-enyl diphosphate reductase n=1 Tax=Pyruvatibacter mobilis TaxID=1712261 RepID=A0A845QCA6_9HYPH|nr:4-hydroxy-3-methylbut-2-enyl diphosphate reductase [Pyruvatibacter mobilis]NBG96243.1 4-hydroxy-3-methylbut-2-enyl diphosphate reductase [Pyruvatibacter mobilis]QJD75744.1 4-hydroxy-3-methylbut-2-enyl diphosphate reductase [Pyruvatibacter mobilis]GGD18183.1 4-hydroxy-3-methylbut-2-enyl diphosphate reductase [Pyruvatibacter mobilis]
MTHKPLLSIRLAAPRGFCAGVDRAILMVERAIEKYGAPVYVRHEIVHNRHVVEGLEAKGAVFVEELEEIADKTRPVIFSAHGVPKSVPADAESRGMFYLDATCPLVSKVHVEANRHHDEGRHILMIGHKGHPEVVGTLGQLPEGAITLVETVEDADAVSPPDPMKLAYVTQTTLSLDDTLDIVNALTRRFPAIRGPHKNDICYATTNRQAAIKAIAEACDMMLVVGAPNSSNSVRLVEVAQKAGCPEARLVQKADEVDWEALDRAVTSKDGRFVLGISAGASAPELLVQDVIAEAQARFMVTVEEVTVSSEDVIFKLPRALTA